MNIYDEMRKTAMKFYAKTALSIIDEDSNKTDYAYSDVLRMVDKFAVKLEKLGVRAGTRVGIASESCPQWNCAFMACAKLRATAVLIDYALPKGEMLTLFAKAQLGCVICSPKVIEKIGEIPFTPVMNLAQTLELAENSCDKLNTNVIKGDENCGVIIFSSGTTRTASGIMHTHDSQILSCRMVCEANKITSRDRFLGILPNSHIYGLFAQVIAPMILGASVCFLTSLNAKGLTDGFEQFKPTIIPGVPKVYELLKMQVMKQINSGKATSLMFKKTFPVALKMRKVFGINMGKALYKKIHQAFGGEVRYLCSAGSPMTKETAEFYYGTGFGIRNNYGATETSIPTIGNYGVHVTTDTCGRTYPDIKLKIAQNGEIMLKSPYFMLGYFNDEEATREAFTEDGWFHSGDLGKFDKHKNIVILGRCKENIVLATGKKVAPDDIEQAYLNVSNVDEMVVCGVPSEDGGYDEVHAFVVAKEEFHDEIGSALTEISKGVNQAMKLNAVHFVNSIPRTAIGKPKRYLLKKMVQEDSLEKLEKAKETELVDTTDIPVMVRRAVAKVAGCDVNDVKGSMKILEDFTIDSLSAIELAVEIESFSGVKVDEEINGELTVQKLITLVQNPDRIHKTSVKSKIYPLNKKKIDYSVYRFYRNLVKAIYEVKIINDDYLPDDDGYIICANHVSNFDFLFLTQNFRRDRFAKFCCMAKKELFKDKFLHKLVVRVGGMVPVDRGGQVGETMTALKEKLSQKWGVLVHPEGTRSKSGEMAKFKSGAALLAIESDKPIVPAYIKGGHEIFPPDQKMPKLFDFKRMKKYKVTVIYGRPIYPDGESADELTQKVQQEVAVLKQTLDANAIPVKDKVKLVKDYTVEKTKKQAEKAKIKAGKAAAAAKKKQEQLAEKLKERKEKK